VTARRGSGEKCVGRKDDGSRCGRWPIVGSTVCPKHGGSTPQVKRKAAERVLEKSISDTLGKLQIVSVVNPLAAMAELAGEVLAWKDLAAGYVAELKTLDTVNFVTGAAEVQATVVVFERAMDRAIDVLGTIARLKIDERLVAISEAQGKAMAEIMRSVLADPALALTAEQRRAVPDVARRHLSVVAA